MEMFAFSTSLSFGVLGTVLLYRKFDTYYGGLCLFIAILGYFCPFLLILPYFFVVWRVLLGRHMQTDAKLFIGQHRRHNRTRDRDPDPSESSTSSLAHWIVATQSGSSDDYRMTHATGEVVSGLGERRPYKRRSREWMEERYDLHHVGWVTRKERENHMQQVQENEPMASGYSCQEFAVDIAFQISSSRTYTFMKCVTLTRVRTVIYFSMMIFSGLVFLWQNLTNQPVIVFVPINSELFNPVMITNIFIAMEAYRLGYTNLRREHNFWGGLKDRLHVYCRVISYRDMFKLTLLFLFSTVVQIWINNIMLTVSILMVAIFMVK